MKRHALLTIIALFFFSAIAAQKIGEWNTLFSYEKDITAIAQSDELVYAVSDGKLFSYNPSDNSVETYAKIGEDSITHISYIKSQECLLVVRSNSDIDLLFAGAKYFNIPDLKNISLNLDKKINDVFTEGDLAYISTNFGLVILDVARREVKESATFRYPFYSCTVYNDKIYVVTSNGSLRINKSKTIQYPDNWESVNFNSSYAGSENFDDKEIQKLITFDNSIILHIPSKGTYSYNETQTEKITSVTNPQNILLRNGRMIISNANSFRDFSSLTDSKYVSFTDNNLLYLIPYNSKPTEYWAAFVGKQLSSGKLTAENQFEITAEGIRPNGPLSNYAFNMTFDHDKLLVVGGRATNRASGFPAQLSEYKNNLWFNFDKKEIDDISGIDSKDFINVVADPSDPNHLFVSCFGGTGSTAGWRNGGIYEFQDRKFVKHHNHTTTPSIENAVNINGVVLMKGMDFDKSGNLWMQNPLLTTNSIVIRKKDGTWKSLYYNEISKVETNPSVLIVDRYNNKWSATYKGDNYLFIFNEGNAPIENTSGHQTRYIPLSEFTDQDGNSLNGAYELLCLKEDLNGNIWVGTNIGIYLIYNSSAIFDKNRRFVFNKIKVPKNDGSNEANILLENVPIQAIAVDGGNRKWIGTPSGLYVVSANGLETHHYFTKDNSILPSSNILSLAINPTTGLVYIGTDKGIVTFKGEATQGEKNYSSVYAYPNPVKPDYDGPIAITGLMENSTVKITDVKGNLINQGTSLGGQYIWDGRNIKREKVDTGVYLIFGSSQEGKEGVVTKIMVVSNN